jgi:hypothetical protein
MKSFGSYCWVSYDWNVCNTRSANAFFTYKDCIGAGHLGRSLQCWQVSATERSLPSFKTCADTEVGWGCCAAHVAALLCATLAAAAPGAH